MPLTGRAVRCPKTLADEAKAVDLALLRAKGFFKGGDGILWNSSWTTRGEPSGVVSYWREDDHGKPRFLWFCYNVQKHGGEWRPLEYPVSIVPTRCHFGGVRHWFICPLTVNGRACGRRCRSLYLAGDAERFGCRECLRLSYATRRNHRNRFWELCHKHDAYVERANLKYRKPRGRKAKERRRGKLAVTERAASYGEAALERMIWW
jgi:hypothetical protein